jgi:hypothetical protein
VKFSCNELEHTGSLVRPTVRQYTCVSVSEWLSVCVCVGERERERGRNVAAQVERLRHCQGYEYLLQQIHFKPRIVNLVAPARVLGCPRGF